MKKNRVKDAFLEHLRKVPIVQAACEQVGVSRNSVYTWRNTDPSFRKQMEEALAEGEALMNDITENQLLSLISEKHWPAISFWLTKRNSRFRDRVDVRTTFDSADDTLSLEQETLVREALRFSAKNNYGKKTHPHG